uniref:Regulatory protein E2 n=1 Tax=Canine oral papillomavirus TaxID=35258 RepID=A0A2P1EPW9_COPV|nr:early protein 2 [Lambdapapillomavirus 2]AVM18354.1 early protein 2 [Lambdapapillomavirus 2]
MEKLSEALDLLQEELLSLYEQNSQSLADQSRHWSLLRKEQVLLYYARGKGIMRIGMQPVPPQSVSQAKAKQAIEQSLYIDSLLHSKFANEPWTLCDTSRERLVAEPAYTFKKGGKQIDVRYDDSEENIVRYVLWLDIYYQDEFDTWEKAHGKLDHKGLSYMHGTQQVYYVDFEEEANKYSETGKYEILNQPTTIPTTSAAGTSGPELPGHSASGSGACSLTPRKGPSRRPGRRSSRFPRRSGGRGRLGRGGSGELPPQPQPSSSWSPPSPQQVGSKHQLRPTSSAGGRLGRLLQEAYDPPVLVLAGDPNSLKCIRYRLSHKHRGLYLGASTTWKWTSGGDGASKHDRGSARMLLAFLSDQQREDFMDRVTFPKSVRVFRGGLDEL